MKITSTIMSLGNSFLNPVSISLISSPDQPIFYTNKEFQNLIMAKEEDVLGKNCRFLQGEKTDREAVARIKSSISNRLPICQDLLNYKFNGDIFYNRLVLVPFKEDKQDYYLGLQHEIDIAQFKPIHPIAKEELLDKTMNPMAILVMLMTCPGDKFDEDLLATMQRIKNYILSL